MNVSLTPRMEKFIRDRVKEGRYGTASEVVREALRTLEQREELHRRRLKELRHDIQIGIDQLDRGEGAPFDAKIVADIKRRGRARLKVRRKSRAA